MDATALDRRAVALIDTDAGRSLVDVVRVAEDAAAVAAAWRRTPGAVALLRHAEVDALDIARCVSDVVDAMTARLIDHAIGQLGPPPVPWAWVALGSAARREQSIVTDQDHAIAFDGPHGDVDEYYRRLAAHVTTRLERAGIPRCRADVVALHPSLRRSIADWTQAFAGWTADPRRSALRQAMILFDHRTVVGSLELTPLVHDAIAASDRTRLARQLRAVAFEQQPSLLARVLRPDPKRDGLLPIVTLARILAVQGAVHETGTAARLRCASARGWLAPHVADALVDAFRVFWSARLDRQLRRLAPRAPAGPAVSRADLVSARRTIRAARRDPLLLGGSNLPVR